MQRSHLLKAKKSSRLEEKKPHSGKNHAYSFAAEKRMEREGVAKLAPESLEKVAKFYFFCPTQKEQLFKLSKRWCFVIFASFTPCKYISVNNVLYFYQFQRPFKLVAVFDCKKNMPLA